MEQDNVRALLRVIRKHESGDNYGAVYSYAFQITDFSDHPANMGWRGVTLPDHFCAGAGLSPGCVSTAAGAYQFIRPTWNRLRDRLALADFSPESQDAAAYAYLDELGAIEAVKRGDVQEAFRLASRAWASMPYSTSGQPKQNLETVIAEFEDFGGVRNV